MEGFLGLEELDGEDFDISAIQAVEVQASKNPDKDEKTELQPKKESRFIASKPMKKMKKKKESDSAFSSEHPSAITNLGQKELETFSRVEDFMDIDAEAENTASTWNKFDLPSEIVRGLRELKFDNPTKIQELAIPEIMYGSDVIGQASTGSGKTLAFGLPILQQISSSTAKVKSTSGLIIAPTRELAQQISQHLKEAAKFMELNIVCITGGLSLDKQLRLLKYTPDIVVATPGRLWDIMSTIDELSSLFLSLKFLVLDEADRVLQTGHFKEVQQILEALGNPANRQTLIFSATFDRDLQHRLSTGKFKAQASSDSVQESLELLLQKVHFRKPPRYINANIDTMVAEAVRQYVLETEPLEKDYYLYYMLLRYSARTLVFTNSIGDVHRLVRLLSTLGIDALGLHSNKQQKARLTAIERFKAEPNRVLIATDIAARGLDIASVDTVIHYHLPTTADLYIHRSGRTARAHTSGLSVAICSSTELPKLRKMQRALGEEKLPEFPIDSSSVGAVKPRVNTARSICKLEAELSDASTRSNTWLAEAAADLGADLDTIEEDQSSQKKRFQLKALKLKIKEQLKVPIANGLSIRYLTKNGPQVIDRLISSQSHKDFLGQKVQSALESCANA